MNIVMESEKTAETYRYYRNKLTYVHKHLTVYGHKLTEHATIIYSRSELALEEAQEECHPLRAHLQDIHESSKEVATLSISCGSLAKTKKIPAGFFRRAVLRLRSSSAATFFCVKYPVCLFPSSLSLLRLPCSRLPWIGVWRLREPMLETMKAV